MIIELINEKENETKKAIIISNKELTETRELIKYQVKSLNSRTEEIFKESKELMTERRDKAGSELKKIIENKNKIEVLNVI